MKKANKYRDLSVSHDGKLEEQIGRHCRLWAAVLLTAVEDCRREKLKPFKGPSIRWIESNDHSPTSFSWVCSILGVDHEYARKKIFERVGI